MHVLGVWRVVEHMWCVVRGAWWYVVVVYDGMWWWYMVVCGMWCMVVCGGGIWWCVVVVYGGAVVWYLGEGAVEACNFLPLIERLTGKTTKPA